VPPKKKTSPKATDLEFKAPERRNQPKGGPVVVVPAPPVVPPVDLLPRLPEAPPERVDPNDVAKAGDILAELTRRRIEALRLYEPLPVQASFHASAAAERLLRGSNRGGKTLPAAVEIARAVTGQDPCDKYPKTDGRCFCIGKDGKHIGQVMWRKLGRAGAFRILRDRATGAWRAWRPWVPEDFARKDETKPAPALIPARLIKSISWEKKAETQPNLVTLHNGWEIAFFSSLGKPPQGSDLDLVWFDEEIVDGEWYPEMSARLLDRRGKFVWSATPQAGTEHLWELHERCEKQEQRKRPSCQEFFIRLADNPHIAEEDKRDLEDKLAANPDAVAVRIGGEYAQNAYKVYPEFSIVVHGMDLEGPVPIDWTRYMVVDPGHQVCAVLFGAVPPPRTGNFLLLYDELYLLQCSAAKFAKAVALRTEGQVIYVSLIDRHAGITTQIGSGRTIEEQYTDALKEAKFKSIRSGPGFVWGSDDVDGGITAVHSALRLRDDGTPRLRVLRGRLPNFETEIKRYHNKRIQGVVLDKPENRRRSHLMDCLRYLVMHDPGYHKFALPRPKPGPAVMAFRARQKRKKETAGMGYVRLG
jgi:hypothetical protein